MTVRRLEIVRGLWGATLLLAPQRVMRAVGTRPDARSVMVARVLGGRQLAQAALSGLQPSPAVVAMGVWVDALHALTTVPLAALDRPRARLALGDGLVASTWSALGWADLGGDHTTGEAPTGWRDQSAVRVLQVAPGGRRLLALAGL